MSFLRVRRRFSHYRKASKFLLAVLTCLLMAAHTPSLQSVIIPRVYSDSSDGWTYSWGGGSHSDTVLTVGDDITNNYGRSFVKFSLSGISGTLSFARLYLYVFQSIVDGIGYASGSLPNPRLGDCQVIHIDDYGTLDGSDFNAPSIGNDPGVLISGTATPNVGYVSIDVTAAMQDDIYDGRTFSSFMIKLATDTDSDGKLDNWYFYASEQSGIDKDPYIGYFLAPTPTRPLFHPDTEFWFTWYDKVDTEICNIHFVNTGTSEATVTVYIDGSSMGSFTLDAGLSTYRNYAVNNGPVQVVGTQALWVTKRVVGWGGFKEVYGLPDDAASKDIYYTWYDFASPGVTSDRIYLTNPSASSTATAQIYIGGSLEGAVTLNPGESKYEEFLGVIDGPVHITSDIPIYSTQLVIGWSDFDEIVGTPSWYVSKEHYFTWYDLAGASIDNIHIINLGASTATINIWIAGILKTSTPITLPSGEQTYVNYPGVVGGPVHIVSDQPIRVTQRIVGWGGFKEVFSVPAELLASAYYFTWYDWASPPVTWDALHFMNPSATQTAHITIWIGGANMGTATLPPGQAGYATFQSTINGPVLITSDIPIMATQRILGWSSFEETIGMEWTTLIT
jgi:hypothetical protein